ncbi:MAG TPA: terminase family protein [Pseudolabrys sp.]|nr:terminase family protein [Pseudolabrys sp.]
MHEQAFPFRRYHWADEPLPIPERPGSQKPAILRTAEEQFARTKLLRYAPVPKQRMFHRGGCKSRERLLMAGNQVGKTTAAGAETAMHLTGRYPHWWDGRRFEGPVRGWVGSIGFTSTRDGAQRVLLGEPKRRESWGTGMIPGDDILDWSLRGGLPDVLDSMLVRHVSGGVSTLGFKSYEQGREKWQGETLDFVWFDEEPPLDIYIEGLTRTNATGGLAYITLTPLKGMTPLLQLFMDCPGFNNPDYWDEESLREMAKAESKG